MKRKISALLIHQRPDPWRALRTALESLGVETRAVRTCGEARAVLGGDESPHVVLTDVQLADGNWADVIALSRKLDSPLRVIVVANHVDVPLYLEALESGAYDFMTPPFEPEVLQYIVSGAAGEDRRRWNTSSHPARRASDRKPALPLKESSQ